MSKGGAGTISFGTGVFQNRRQPKIAVNSLLFSILAFLALIFAFIVLIFIDFSAGTWTVNGVERAPTILEAWGLKSILFFLLLIPMIQRMWSYNAIEKKIGAAN